MLAPFYQSAHEDDLGRVEKLRRRAAILHTKHATDCYPTRVLGWILKPDRR